MLDQGLVVKVDKNLAWVEFVSSAECAKCGACHRASEGKMVLETENPVGARVGDRVEVDISPIIKTVVPFISFGIPIISFFIGLILGGLFSETMGIIWGMIFLALGFIFVRMFDRYVAKQKTFRCKIARKI